MKKILAFLLAAALLFGAALAEDIHSLTDEELKELYYLAAAEMESRGLLTAAPEEHSLFRQENVTPEDEAAGERLMEFFIWWSRDDLDNMLTVCDPAWRAGEEDPRLTLFALLRNRTPVSAELRKISGKGADRTIGVETVIDRHNGKENLTYLLQLRMKKADDGSWYLDPMSLIAGEEAHEPVETMPAPAEEADGLPEDTRLYYVAGGGSRYHLDPYCRLVNEKYLPMQDSFPLKDLDNPLYADLEPCSVCGAPARGE